MGVGRQQRGPFQGVRVKNSVKELLLHIRSHKQKASSQAVDDFKVGPAACYELEEFTLSGLLFSADLVPVSPLQFFIEGKVHGAEAIFVLLALFLPLCSAPGCKRYFMNE